MVEEAFLMVYQSYDSDCGKASVRNLLSEVYKDDSYEIVPLNNDCEDFLSIREELLRFDCKYTSYDVDRITQVTGSQLPGIANVSHAGKSHFVLLLKIGKKKVEVLDPQFGRYALSLNEFHDVFLHKMLLKDTIGKKEKHMKKSLLLRSEKVCYFLCFLFQAILATFLVLSTGSKDAFMPSMISLLGLLGMMVLQSSLNRMILRRLEEKVMMPYLQANRARDMDKLSSLFLLCIKRHSNALSYGFAIYVLMFLLIFNRYFLSFLSLIAIAFLLIRVPLAKEKNKVNRDCSLLEESFREKLNQGDETGKLDYQKAKRKTAEYGLRLSLSYLLEFICCFSLVFIDLSMNERLNINLLCYYLSLSLSLSFVLHRFYVTVLDRSREISCINSLSSPLALFFAEKQG